MIMETEINYVAQPNEYTCVPACVKMLTDYFYGSDFLTLDQIQDLLSIDEKGTDIDVAFGFLDFILPGLRAVRPDVYVSPQLQLIAYDDEPGEGHTAIVLDIVDGMYVLHDPYYGEYMIVPVKELDRYITDVYLLAPSP